jgi:hypothetical protein
VNEFNSEFDSSTVFVDFVDEVIGVSLAIVSIYCSFYYTNLTKYLESHEIKFERMQQICLLDAILCFLSGRIPDQTKLAKRTKVRLSLSRNDIIT